VAFLVNGTNTTVEGGSGLPCQIFEDEHLLVANKPAGLNTHSPSPYAGEGLFDWLRNREPRWARLAIIHRLDKETSGLIVFAKTPLANRQLTNQFTRRSVLKKYLLLTDCDRPETPFTVRTSLIRAGDKYVARPPHAGAEIAETKFRKLGAWKITNQRSKPGNCLLLEAEPLTGRTHQIRVHAALKGFPVLGDTLYGGTPADRVYLHAAELTLQHPEKGRMTFHAPIDFEANPRMMLRKALIDGESTSAYRLIHGASDGWPGWYVDRLGDFIVVESEQTPDGQPLEKLKKLMGAVSARGVYYKRLTRQVGKATLVESSPQLLLGQEAPERFTIRENGLTFELSFKEGYSVGLFLDQRDNRRRLLTGCVAAGWPPMGIPLTRSSAALSPFDGQSAELKGIKRSIPEKPENKPEVLNAFAYTCGFSVCAAAGGARTTSLDLSKKYLEWGRRNFAMNGLNPADHDFIYGDVFDWFARLAKKHRSFHVILIDPPTFSRSKETGAFHARKDYGKLVEAALPLLKPDGTLFLSTNSADWPAEDFIATVEQAIKITHRKVLHRHYVPQPPDFPVSKAEPAYLKTLWLRVS
jgi:23S rRNA (cytosine1962-C5)-methyltransferase